MDLSYGKKYEAFRREIDQFLERNELLVRSQAGLESCGTPCDRYCKRSSGLQDADDSAWIVNWREIQIDAAAFEKTRA